MTRISDLTEVNQVSGGDLFPIDQGASGRTRSVSFQVMKDNISAEVNAAVEEAVEAAERAEEAAASADAQVLREDLATEGDPLKGAELVGYESGTVADKLGELDAFSADLQNQTDPAKGAAIVGRGVVSVDSIADLLAIPEGARKADQKYLVSSYYGLDAVYPGFAVVAEYVDARGGGQFRWNPDSTETENGFNIFGSGTGRFERVIDGPVTPEMAGARWGSDFDAGPALRTIGAYFDAVGGGVLEMNPMADYHCSTTADSYQPPVFDFADNVHIDGHGCTIRTDASVTAFSYAVLRNRLKTGCSARNLNLIGNRQYGTGVLEAGHGISSLGSRGFLVENVSCSEMGGDGLYVGADSPDPESCTKNMTIRAFSASACRRQGISFISADGFIGSGIAISDISGTAPQAGIDFEPNTNVQRLRGIRLRDVRVSGCAGQGVQFYLANLDATSTPVDIEIDGLEVIGCNQGMGFQRGNGGVVGSIRMNGLTQIGGSTVDEFVFETFSNVAVDIDRLSVSTALIEPLTIGTDGGVPGAGAVSANLRIRRLDLNSTYTGPYAAGVKIRGINQDAIRDIDIALGSLTFANTTTRKVWFDATTPYSFITIGQAFRNAGQRTITASYTYNSVDHSPEYLINAATNMTVSTLVAGVPITVRTNFAGAQLRLAGGSGLKFFGGSVEGALTLTSTDSFVTVVRLTGDPTTIRVVSGFNYTIA